MVKAAAPGLMVFFAGVALVALFDSLSWLSQRRRLCLRKVCACLFRVALCVCGAGSLYLAVLWGI